jgi:methionyl-tRNA synthetase
MNEQDTDIIPIDVATQIELRVGTIENCEEIPKSDKLLKLTVNFGPKGIRTILAGVKKWYQANDLIGKQVVFIYNLKPRKMLGIESQGMMLFAESDNGRLEYITPATLVPDGTKLR